MLNDCNISALHSRRTNIIMLKVYKWKGGNKSFNVSFRKDTSTNIRMKRAGGYIILLAIGSRRTLASEILQENRQNETTIK